MLKNIDLTDILVFVGLSLLGVGLFLSYGIEITFMVIGSLLFLIGIGSVIFKGK